MQWCLPLRSNENYRSDHNGFYGILGVNYSAFPFIDSSWALVIHSNEYWVAFSEVFAIASRPKMRFWPICLCLTALGAHAATSTDLPLEAAAFPQCSVRCSADRVLTPVVCADTQTATMPRKRLRIWAGSCAKLQVTLSKCRTGKGYTGMCHRSLHISRSAEYVLRLAVVYLHIH